jgi:hypothetical protein
VEYVNFLWNKTKLPGKDGARAYLAKDIPILGPRFIPPSFSLLERRQYGVNSGPETTYIKPFNVVHPFFYPTLEKCPQCHLEDTTWDGWTGTGSREVHGLFREETALGFQLRCKACENTISDSHKSFCFATTNSTFWQHWEHWQIPSQL